MTSAAYGEGVGAARAAFGIRTAALSPGRMSEGPAQLGASRFASAVSGDAPLKAAPSPKQNRMDRPTVWGAASSPEAGGFSNNDSALRYSGV